MFEFRDSSTTQAILKKIKEIKIDKPIKIMHVCGSHERTITHWGLRNLLDKKIELIPGPGCPVCVTPPEKIDWAIELLKREDIILTTFGDMVNVPGTSSSIGKAKRKSDQVKIVFGVNEAIELAKKTKKEVVHFSIGFETTAPSVAGEILKNQNLKNFSIICAHCLIPPVMEALLSQKDIKIDAFICPGHVSTIIGLKPYQKLVEKYKVPMVISGFEPNDVLLSVLMILRQIKKKEVKVENEYLRSVKPEGNVLAKKMMEKVFEICSFNWRGMGLISHSGLKLKKEFERFDAQKKFDNIKVKKRERKTACKCGEILKGKAMPKDCPLFGKICTPQTPIGACMVSSEGACNIAYYEGY